MSQPSDARNIYDSAFRKRMAHAIVEGIVAYKRAVERPEENKTALTGRGFTQTSAPLTGYFSCVILPATGVLWEMNTLTKSRRILERALCSACVVAALSARISQAQDAPAFGGEAR